MRSACLIAALLVVPLATSAQAAPDLTPRLDPPPAAPSGGDAGPEGDDAGDVRTPNPLHVNLMVSLPVTLALGALSVGLAVPNFAPAHCAWCLPDSFDVEVREALKLNVQDARYARQTSDLLVNAAIPAGVMRSRSPPPRAR